MKQKGRGKLREREKIEGGRESKVKRESEGEREGEEEGEEEGEGEDYGESEENKNVVGEEMQASGLDRIVPTMTPLPQTKLSL